MTAPTPYPPCPNCGSDEIIRTRESTGYAAEYIVAGPLTRVYIARLVCLQCGLVREWVDNRRDLELLRKKFGDQLRPR